MYISVVIATCDRPESLARTLTRVAESLASAGASCPVIVADNGGNAPAAGFPGVVSRGNGNRRALYRVSASQQEQGAEHGCCGSRHGMDGFYG